MLARRLSPIAVLLTVSCTPGLGDHEAEPVHAEAQPKPEAQPKAQPKPKPKAQLPEPAAPVDPRRLLAAAHAYPSWGRVDELPNVAPVLCRAPFPSDHGYPSHARLSEADDAPHGRKLYYLYAGLPEGEQWSTMSARYRQLGSADAPATELPIGFTVVKQSWTSKPGAPKRATKADDPTAMFGAPEPVTWVETDDGELLQTDAQADLFVMYKAGPADTPGTDAGWIYATLTPDGSTVTGAGRIEQCMGCHEAAPHERLFGLQSTRAMVPMAQAEWGLDGGVDYERLGVRR